MHICLGVCYGWQTGVVVDSSGPQQISFRFALPGNILLVPTIGNAYFLTGELSELDSAQQVVPR